MLFRKILFLFLYQKKTTPLFFKSGRKQLYVTALFIFCSILLQAQYKASGGIKTPYEIEIPEVPSMNKIFIFNTLSNSSLSYKTSSGLGIRWFYYTQSAADKIEILASEIEITSFKEETTYTIKNPKDATGYFVMEGTKEKPAIWVCDYTYNQAVINQFHPLESADKCEYLKLIIDTSDNWFYFLKSGERKKIPRKYKITYQDLEWNQATWKFENIERTIDYRTFGTEYVIDAPLKNTPFTLSGDEAGEYFGLSSQMQTNIYEAVSVKSYFKAKQQVSNDKLKSDKLGGSAPAIITFTAYANEPVAQYYTWYIFHQDKPSDAIARYTDNEIEYTFEKAGTYTVRLEVANAQSSCVDSTQMVQFSISESSLEIPNYFSPDATDGSSTQFKVAYKSLIKFNCTIFNRWGVKLHRFSDPDKGWSGQYNGRLVPTGVYYYVIEAIGSDGRVYKKGGDINVIRSKK